MTRETIRAAFKNHWDLLVNIYGELLTDWDIDEFLENSPTPEKLNNWINLAMVHNEFSGQEWID